MGSDREVAMTWQHLRRSWRIAPVVSIVAITHFGQLPVAGASRAAPITLRLDRVHGITSIPQGAPFPFAITARNSRGIGQNISVMIELRSPSTGSQDIRTWSAKIPAGGSLRGEMSEVSSQWFAETGTFTLIAWLEGHPIGNSLTSVVTAPTVVVPTFQDVTGAAGLSTNLPGDGKTSHAEGAAWGDVNGDGFPDLYVPIRDQPAQLWVFDPGLGAFTEQAVAWDVANPGGVGVSAVFADFDNDGDEDLYVVNDAIDPVTAEPTGQGNRLYRNDHAQGRDGFTDVSAAAGVETQGNGASASWGDYDADGLLDLYAVTGNAHRPTITYYQQDHLFHNNGDGTFTDVTCQSLPTNDPSSGFCPGALDMGGSTGSGFEAVWLDVEGDGDQDLYLAQDYAPVVLQRDTNRLYRNDGFDPSSGHWKFTDVCAPPGDSAPECLQVNSMGAAVADYNGDLWPDLAISNIGGNILLRNDRAGGFTEVGSAAGVARLVQDANVRTVTWGLGFSDFNLDASEDLYVAAGAIATSRNQPNQMFVGTSGGSFLDLSTPAGLADPGVGRGVSFADYDRDGLVDVYLVNVAGAPILYRNTTNTTGHWLEVHLTGTVSSRDPCGARAVLTSGGVRQVRWLTCGSSLGAGDDMLLHFGGLAGGTFSVAVTWPSGAHQTVQGTGPDQLIKVTEGSVSRP
jgi:hypothetical protein